MPVPRMRVGRLPRHAPAVTNKTDVIAGGGRRGLVRMSGTVPMTDLALRDKIMVRFLHFNFFSFPYSDMANFIFFKFQAEFSFLISKIKIFKFSWHILIFSFPYGGMPIFLKFQFKFTIDFSNFPFHMA
jgi:hypothetical protein